MVGSVVQREAVYYAKSHYKVSERRACRTTNIARTTVRYQKRKDEDQELRQRLKALASSRRRFGSPRLTVMLRREGYKVNHKRVERIYKEEGLQLKKRKKRRQTAAPRVVIPPPTQPNERWSMDFVSDSIASGRKFRCLTIIDDFSRESPAIVVDTSLPGQRVTAILRLLGINAGVA